MIIKVTTYFDIEKQPSADDLEVTLQKEQLEKSLDEYLSESSFRLSGSRWNDSRITARHVTHEEALDLLRTRK